MSTNGSLESSLFFLNVLQDTNESRLTRPGRIRQVRITLRIPLCATSSQNLYADERGEWDQHSTENSWEKILGSNEDLSTRGHCHRDRSRHPFLA